MRKTINSIRTDLRKWCNRKKIQEKRNSDHLFQYNNVLDYPKFLDLNEPLLITGMEGVGAVAYTCQIAIQALEKGYVVIDHAGGIQNYCITGAHLWGETEYIELRDEGFVLHANRKELTPFVHGSEVITPFGAISSSLNAEARQKLNSVLANCTNFSELPVELTKAGLKVLVISYFRENEGLDALDHRYKNIALSLSHCEGYAAFKNRVHMRDIKRNLDLYVPEIKTPEYDLHQYKIGHGYCVLPGRTSAINWLYYRTQKEPF
jgi:hypothetical protein